MPPSALKVFTRVSSFSDHTYILSWDAEASKLRSGLYAMLETGCKCFVNVWLHFMLSVSHTRTVASKEPLANCVLEPHSIAQTSRVCCGRS
mmetsp:Transcript_11749/g.22626  ORF Transcript_11749/g.22626 Transcript_11749/m.22626 type:complete len:91 (-) Transcript_11749:1130-1402(-)